MATSKRKRRTGAKRRNASFSSLFKPARRRRRSNPARGTRRYMGSRGAARVGRSMRRRRNPVDGALIGQGFQLAIAGMVIGFAQPTVRGLLGRFLPTGPIASAGITLATAYGLGALAGFTRFTAKYKKSLELSGWTIAAAQLVSSYVVPALSNFTAGFNLNAGGGAQMSGPRRLRGIAAVHGIPPQILPPPPVVQAAPKMNGIAAVPGMYR